MKKIMNRLIANFTMFWAYMVTGVYAYGQENTDTLSSADYHFEMPKHVDPFYNGPMRFVVIGIVLAVMAYVGYRYFADARAGKDIWHDVQ